MSQSVHVALFFNKRISQGVHVIAFIEGSVLSIDTNSLVINVHGVGYQLLVSKKDIDELVLGQNAAFFVHTHVREDALELFGFKSSTIKHIFQLLISVSGVGPKLALSILSALRADEIKAALIEKDIALLSSVPGIGKKTAERLSLELKEKALKLPLLMENKPSSGENTLINVTQAIRGLGYSKAQCDWALTKLEESDIALPLEELVKKTINLLAGLKAS